MRLTAQPALRAYPELTAAGRYEPSVNLVIFSLAGVLTQISVMSDFHKALLTNGVLKQLSNQFKANAKKGKGLNILALANQQQRDNYNTEVSAEITVFAALRS